MRGSRADETVEGFTEDQTDSLDERQSFSFRSLMEPQAQRSQDESPVKPPCSGFRVGIKNRFLISFGSMSYC